MQFEKFLDSSLNGVKKTILDNIMPLASTVVRFGIAKAGEF